MLLYAHKVCLKSFICELTLLHIIKTNLTRLLMTSYGFESFTRNFHYPRFCLQNSPFWVKKVWIFLKIKIQCLTKNPQKEEYWPWATNRLEYRWEATGGFLRVGELAGWRSGVDGGGARSERPRSVSCLYIRAPSTHAPPPHTSRSSTYIIYEKLKWVFPNLGNC